MVIILNIFKNNFLKIFIVLLIVIILFIATYINQNIIKNNVIFSENLYNNELSTKITNNDLNDIDYNFLNNDLNSIDDILNEQLALSLDKSRKSEYYSIAGNIYSQKINELTRVFNEKLDDEDFERLQNDLDDFQKNIDFAIEDINNTIESSFERKYYTNKYLYEEKQKKCRELLETYKGFLQ